MEAIRYHRYGGPEVLVLEHVAMPHPGPGQLRVHIHAASVNPIDWKLREGLFKAFMPLALPVTTGSDFAGVVDAVGPLLEGALAKWKVGDAVMGMLAAGVKGTCAEYALVEPHELASKPKSMSFVEAAALPMGALTAWLALVDTADVKAGQRVFIHAATGNVGGLAIQIAKAKGAFVIGAARSNGRTAVLDSGADEFVNYDHAPFEKATSKVDVVLDTLAGDIQMRSLELLSAGGQLVSTLGIVDQVEAKRRGIRATGISAVPNGAQLLELTEMVDRGELHLTVGHRFPLHQTDQAQQLNQSGAAKGKIVIDIDHKA